MKHDEIARNAKTQFHHATEINMATTENIDVIGKADGLLGLFCFDRDLLCWNRVGTFCVYRLGAPRPVGISAGWMNVIHGVLNCVYLIRCSNCVYLYVS